MILGFGIEDANISLLHAHLDKAGSTVRIMFFYFCSAFNTIQPALFCKKLQKILDASTTTWIIDYRDWRVVCRRRWSASQGTVLSQFLFTLYTSDFLFLQTFRLRSWGLNTLTVFTVTQLAQAFLAGFGGGNQRQIGKSLVWNNL